MLLLKSHPNAVVPGVGHIRQVVLAHDYAPYNAGVVFYMDFVIPATILGLLAAQRLALASGDAHS